MEDFGPAMDQAELCRIAQVRPGNRGRGISEGVGAVPHGLVFESEVFMLNVHVVDAERLAAVIERTTARAVGVGQGIALDRKSTRLNSSHLVISYAVFCLKKKKKTNK